MSSAPPPAADRNLLLGILALQMDLVSRDALIAAMNAWVLDKTESLGDILVAQQALPAKRLALLNSLVEEHLAQHQHDRALSLAALGAAGITPHKLEQLGDAQVQATFASLLRNGQPHAVEETQADAPRPISGSRFTILRPHAKGGLGEVFVAQDSELDREVALKEIQSRHAHDPISRERFVQEAAITASLEHPGLVPVYGFGT